jgi:hypothetical protein
MKGKRQLNCNLFIKFCYGVSKVHERYLDVAKVSFNLSR